MWSKKTIQLIAIDGVYIESKRLEGLQNKNSSGEPLPATTFPKEPQLGPPLQDELLSRRGRHYQMFVWKGIFLQILSPC